MLDAFDLLFSRMLIKNNKVNFKKEILLGILFSVAFIALFFITKKYLKVFIIGFFLFTSFASFFKENDMFLVYEDLKIFDIKLDDFRFYKIYLIQRLLKDNYITDIILALSTSIFLFINDLYTLIWISIIGLSYLILMPINHKIGIKKPNLIFTKIFIDLLLIIFIFVGAIFNYSYANIILNEPNNMINIGILLMIMTAIIVGLFFISKSKENYSSQDKTKIIYKSISWMKKIDIYVYKDYMLNFSGVVMSIVSTILLFIFICDSNEKFSMLMTIIFVVAPASLFSKKTKKEYDLIKNDYIFLDHNLSNRDIKYVMSSKLRTVLTEVAIKLMLTVVILIIGNKCRDFALLIDVFLISLISSMIHYFIIMRNNRVVSCCIYMVKYTLVLMGIMKVYSMINIYLYFSYIITVLIATSILLITEIRGEKYEKNI